MVLLAYVMRVDLAGTVPGIPGAEKFICDVSARMMDPRVPPDCGAAGFDQACGVAIAAPPATMRVPDNAATQARFPLLIFDPFCDWVIQSNWIRIGYRIRVRAQNRSYIQFVVPWA
ncbi:hypothetical protein K7711_21575 [Nocardia sp. CA2R105]|uniref:hypothetical protein n=1 Tax=Nocardia coffeae TaxID=2873381 RepID=UPI001CA6FE9F|nr:hypothetical protein [Nocardia coffeae]MBY8859079.1 hypothetical protein [Nocardia coffeae]